MQRLLFESSPLFIFLCAGVALGYAYLLYKARTPWSKTVNRILFALRTILVFFLAVLLLGPVLRLITNYYEKPTWVYLVDTSSSVAEVLDSTARGSLVRTVNTSRKALEELGYESRLFDLAGNEISSPLFNAPTSDLNTGIVQVINQFEGRNLAGITLVSDGIYNSGTSPVYAPVRVPVYTLGVGDTTLRVDVVLKNVAFNKVAYEGNKFPVRAQVVLQGIGPQPITVSVLKEGKVIATQNKESHDKAFLDFDFQLDANQKGIQRYDVTVKSVAGETNVRNNATSIFIEVVEGKKKIVLIAPAPHPDIKALKSVVEKNANYEFILHIPGVTEAKPDLLKPGAAELFIFHQAIDLGGKTLPLFQTLYRSNASVLLMIGSNTNLRQLAANQVPLQFESAGGQWDEVTPVVNAQFREFGFADNTNGIFARYPPAQVPFGKFTWPVNASVLLQQRIGSIATDRPMLFTWPDNNRKIAVLVGEGIWRWRLREFADTGHTLAFDELFSKLVQYLSTLEDKRRFRSFPLQNEFSDAEPVVIESQVYNELFELVYGNTVKLEVRNEQGQISKYSYVLSPGGARYRLAGLKEGVYRFTASTQINEKSEIVNGQFLVRAQNVETQNLTADFSLLRTLAQQTGGRFYQTRQAAQLSTDLQQVKTASLIHTEETFNQLINLKWVFFLLLALISVEWFMRKYLGGY
ncbi:MAG: VWA domain-containing protein [Cyclobacteriaceae bacterium]|nr:VWA domain-containing protein [Cyclobacteriaceae bacterium]